MTSFRNVAVSWLGLLGYDSPSEGRRHFAWNPAEAIRIVTKHRKRWAAATLK
jgi:hypothetical protein